MLADNVRADGLILRVRLFLNRSNMPALRRLDVQAVGDRVILSGKVGSYYERQLATELTRRVVGVIDIDNRIDVTSYAPRAMYAPPDRY